MRAPLGVGLSLCLVASVQTLRRAAAEAPVPSPAASLAGRWQLNRDQSEDARTKMRDARKGRRQGDFPGAHGGVGGGHRGGPRGGSPPGGGPQGGPMAGPDGDGPPAALSELFDPAETLTIAQSAAEVDIDDGRAVLRLYPDGRKSKREGGAVEVKAIWNGSELVAESKLKDGARLTTTYLAAPEKRQLLVTSRLDGHFGEPVTVRRVYEAAAVDPVADAVRSPEP